MLVERVCVLVGLFLSIAMLPAIGSPSEVSSIYGIHDADPNPAEYLNRIKNAVGGGWVTATVEIGHDPSNTSGGDFSWFANEGHTVICRLNNGYSNVGTIPVPAQYDNFAARCANYVQNSSGCDIWLIANETNLASEWPPSAGHRSYVSPQDYASCFRKCYDAIKAVRPNHKVICQALAPFAGPYGGGTLWDETTHDGNPLNWVTYMNQMLTAIKSTGGLDGIAVHINSRGYTYDDVHSTHQINAGGQMLYWSFLVYKDWVNYGTPSDLWHLPFYATECNGIYYWKGGHPENPSSHYENDWMETIYAEIDRYNRDEAVPQGKPVYRCVNMYRWCSWCDGWNIDGSDNLYKSQMLKDLDDALSHGYTWPSSTVPGEIIDNTDSGFSVVSGSWQESTSATDKYGSNYRYKSGADGAARVRWTPTLSETGNYEVYVWYPQGSNRANNTPYIVNHSSGSTTVRVDQTTNGGRWVALGGFHFSAGTGSVELTDDAESGKAVMADAVRVVYSGSGVSGGWWIDDFDDGVLDTSPPEPHWAPFAAGGFSQSEHNGELRMLGASGQWSHGGVSNSTIYSDFSLHTRLIFTNVLSTQGGVNESNAEIRFREQTGGYSLSFKAGTGDQMINLRRSDTWQLIQSKQIPHSYANGQSFYVSLSCSGSNIDIKVGTTAGGSEIVHWTFTDSTFSSGTFRLYSYLASEIRWDYFYVGDGTWNPFAGFSHWSLY